MGRSRRWLLLAGVVVLTLAACGSSYYGQAVLGQARILAKRQPLAQVVARPDLPSNVRARLELVQRVRSFASDALALPDNKSFRQYVELGRPYPVWNVVAAPALSVDPVTWCFPVAGCVAYRGYFAERRARAYAKKLAERGLDVSLYPVQAYSTLGWFADPVLSSFLDLPDADLAGLIFHELAHQVVYLKGDTAFNESFATTVEEIGLEHWSEAGGLAPEALAQRRLEREHDRIFVDRMLDLREQLAGIYATTGESDDWKLSEKDRALTAFRRDLREQSTAWDDSRYDGWIEGDLNNAHVASMGSYHQHVDAFRELLSQGGGELEALYRLVRDLSELPELARQTRLEELATRADLRSE